MKQLILVLIFFIAEATKRPQNMSKEEEIAYILKKADENCDHIEIRKILNVSNT